MGYKWSQGGITGMEEPSATATIYIAGDYAQAAEALREWCGARGDCWAIERASFVYTGGQEEGVRLTRINYPRFPMTPQELERRAKTLARRMLKKLHQRSCTVVGPICSTYLTRDDMD